MVIAGLVLSIVLGLFVFFKTKQAAFRDEADLPVTRARVENERITDDPITNELSKIEIGEVRRLDGHTDFVEQAVFFHDGKRAASASHDATIRIWDLETGRDLDRIDAGNALASIAISPDDRWIAVGFDDKPNASIEIWEIASGERIAVLPGHSKRVARLAFSADGRRLMSSGGDWTMRLWDVETWAALRQFELSNPDTAAFSPDGRLIAGVDRQDDDFVQIWSTESGQSIVRLNASKANKVQRCRFTSDSRMLVTASFLGAIHVWDVASGKPVHEFKAHRGLIYHVELTPDGQHVISSGMDRRLRLWNVRNGSLVAEIDTKLRFFKQLAISPDGQHLLAAAAWTWDFDEGKHKFDRDFDSYVYRLPEPVWPRNVNAAGSPQPREATTSPVDTTELDQLVILTEKEVQRVRTLVENGVSSTMNLMRAEANLIDAMVQRAEARGDAKEVVTLLGKLVSLRERELETLERLRQAGAATDAHVTDAMKAVLEARVRLKIVERAE